MKDVNAAFLVWTHSQYGRKDVGLEAVVTGGDTAKVLQAAEHAFNDVATPPKEWREAVLPAPVRLGQDLRHRAVRLGPLVVPTEQVIRAAMPAIRGKLAI